MREAAALRDSAHGSLVTYSRKVFIPLTKLCRDVCHYCTFAHPPRRGERAFLTRDEVLAIARQGAAAGCREALFTLGDKPELRYAAARDELAALGHATTVSYLAEMAKLVLDETGLLPHANPGVTTAAEIAALRAVCPSQGLMLESVSDRLMARGPGAFRLAGQGARRAARLAGGCGQGGCRDDVRPPDRDRRDAGRADRCAGRAARGARAARPHPGGDRPEFPRQAGHEDGGRARRAGGRAALDRRRRAADPRRGDAYPGAAEPEPRRARPADRRGHRRLGRRVAGDARPCEPRGAVAASRCAGAARRTPAGKILVPRLTIYPEYALAPGTLARRCAAHARAARDGLAGLRSRGRLDAGGERGNPRSYRRLSARPEERPKGPRLEGREARPFALRDGTSLRSGPLRTNGFGGRARRNPRARDARGGAVGSRDRAAVRGARGRGARGVRGGRCAAPRCERRDGQLRGHAQHQLHQRVLVPLQVLRLLQGQAVGEFARPALRSRSRRDRATHRGGMGARRDRGVHAGRHPPRLYRRDIPRHPARGEGGGARHACPRLLAARGVAGGEDARHFGSTRSLRGCARRGWARCPARRPRSSTTRCAG